MLSTSTSTISTDAPVVTLVNVFTVAPEHQEALVRMLEEATEQVMRNRPGFVSANIHRGLDGTKVVNYAQWASQADFRAMLGEPAAHEHFEQVLEIATADPALVEVVSVHHC
jgi:quinol monooxygenase YgiN